jgi:DNA-binding NarL/FixJ family response regulator
VEGFLYFDIFKLLKNMPTKLTPREIAVLDCIAKGMYNKMMSPVTGLAVASIETYRARIYMKLQVKNGCECVAVAIRNGIIQ